MKIDRSRVRKSTSDVPIECLQLIYRLQQCSRTELLEELSKIHSWTFGKCELLHWAQVLDIFDRILLNAAERNEDNIWALKCDSFSGKVSGNNFPGVPLFYKCILLLEFPLF